MQHWPEVLVNTILIISSLLKKKLYFKTYKFQNDNITKQKVTDKITNSYINYPCRSSIIHVIVIQSSFLGQQDCFAFSFEDVSKMFLSRRRRKTVQLTQKNYLGYINLMPSIFKKQNLHVK